MLIIEDIASFPADLDLGKPHSEQQDHGQCHNKVCRTAFVQGS